MIVGIGVDIVAIARLRRVLERRTERFIERVYTPLEQEFCRAHHDPIPHYAARFAAKEALFKALGTGWAQGVGWLEVEVQRRDREAPTLVLSGEAERRSQLLGTRICHISLSHSEESAVAFVILES